MATFNEIKEFRLEISDPAIATNIIAVANSAALPASPAHQTVYYNQDTETYLYTDKTSGATATDYHPVDLYLTDARISSWIDSYGVAGAIPYGIKAILRKIVSQMNIVRDTSGAESTEYQSLRNIYYVYKSIASDTETTNTGRWGSTVTPEIGGGNL